MHGIGELHGCYIVVLHTTVKSRLPNPQYKYLRSGTSKKDFFTVKKTVTNNKNDIP